MKRYTVTELQATIRAKDKLIAYNDGWIHVLGDAVKRQQKTINRQKARIKALGAVLIALEKDYEELKRKRK